MPRQCCPDHADKRIYYKCDYPECQLCISKHGFKQEPLLFDNHDIKQSVRRWARNSNVGFRVK
jgi:hypothetical protein